MGAADSVKDFVRAAQTAGLSKDVIDLLEKKVVLLADEVASLKEENATLLRENHNLHLVNEDLKKKIEQAQPKGDKLDAMCEKMLSMLANNDARKEEIIQHLGLSRAKGDYLCDQLNKRSFIRCSVADHRGLMYLVTAEGREYMARHELH